MGSRIRKTIHTLLLVAFFAACGGHWVVLQSIAWTQMLATHAQSTGIGEAIEKTFDGQHPCDLCKKVERGAKSEKKQDAQVFVAKLQLFFQSDSALPFLAGESRQRPVPVFIAGARFHAPPVPPPRNATS